MAQVTPEPHCPTCRCPSYRYDVTVYPPHEGFYGRCGTCGEVRFCVEVYDREPPDWAEATARWAHCSCCEHAHELARGGHQFSRLTHRMLREGVFLP